MFIFQSDIIIDKIVVNAVKLYNNNIKYVLWIILLQHPNTGLIHSKQVTK